MLTIDPSRITPRLQSVRDKRNMPCWSDLPQEIFEIVFHKLHFVDQIRVFTVCKAWRDSKHRVKCPDTLSWVISTQQLTDLNSFVFQLFDPYLRHIHRVSNFINNVPRGNVYVLASKQGWLFIAGNNSKPFLYNPFTKDYLDLDFPLVECKDMRATISVSGNDLAVFTLTTYDGSVGLDTYTRTGLRSTWIADTGVEENFCCVSYIKGVVYGLSNDGSLFRYGLEDGSWNLLTSESFGWIMTNGWLMELNENLIMVSLDLGIGYDWIVFKFDWSKLCWDVVETRLESCAFYISVDLAFQTPLVDQYGKKLQGCKLFYHDGCTFKCFSLSEDAEEIQMTEYNWITASHLCQLSFIEPPYSWS